MKVLFSLYLFDKQGIRKAHARSDGRVDNRLEKLKGACHRRGCDLSLESSNARIVVAGYPEPARLKAICRDLRKLGYGVIVAIDALAETAGLKSVLSELEAEKFQLSTVAAVLSLMKSDEPKLYAYPKADCTATVCILLDEGANTLVITRKHQPFEGCAALAGGFLRVQLETLRECAAREVREEIGLRIKPSELIAVDERSSPKRDERGHVVDHGYVLIVPRSRRSQLLKELKAGDDAADVQIESVQKLLRQRMAFDHKQLLKGALAVYQRELILAASRNAPKAGRKAGRGKQV